MSGKFVTLCVVGLIGSLFVGYCVYFDRKRRSDPDYKKKVVASKCMSCTGPLATLILVNEVSKLSTPSNL